MLYQKVSELPSCIQNGLRQVGYNRVDISIEAREKMVLGCNTAFEGNRSYVFVVNMETGAVSNVEVGSWGGSNMFVKTAVDDDKREYELPMNVAVIQGESGGRGHFAHMYIRPENLTKYLPSGDLVSEVEHKILYAYGAYKSSYRATILGKVDPVEIASCVKKGYLKKIGKGLGITTEGKNARAAYEAVNGRGYR